MRAAIYARISRDTRDPDQERGLGVDRQVAECRRLAERLGWDVVEVFTDNDISASTLSGKPRPAYDGLIAAVDRGEVGGVLAYSNSRLTRRPLDLEGLIALHDRTGVSISTVVSGTDDLSTADGRMIARIKASVDAAEAERTSERLRAQKAQRAARGLPHGGRWRVFGYGWTDEVKQEDGTSRRVTRDAWQINESEAEIVRESFRRRAAGESVTSIARHFAGRGLTTVSGKLWTSSSLSKVLSRPGYAGLRQHKGEIVGKTSYQPIIEEALWRAANSEMVKASPGTNARVHLLSGFAICGKCSGGVVGNSSLGGYRCNREQGGCGNLRVKRAWLEDPVVSIVMAREVLRTRSQEPAVRPASSQPDVDAIDAEIEAVRAAYGRRELALEDMTPILRDLRSKRRAAEEAAAKVVVATAGPLVTYMAWPRLNLSEQRALLARHLDSVQIGPRKERGPGRYDPTRITLRWKSGEVQEVTWEHLRDIPLRDTDNNRWSFPPGTASMSLVPEGYVAVRRIERPKEPRGEF